MIKIDIDTRCWQIPKEECFLGVESDDKVKILRFELSKNEFCNGLNFTDCNCFINYKNEGNDTIPYLITDMEVQVDGTVTFTWEVSRGATIFKGNTFAILCAKKVSDDGTITNEWNSRIGSFTVAKGIEPLSSITEVPEIDIISQLLSVAQQTNTNAQANIDKSSQLLEKAEGLGYLKEDFDVLEARMNQFTSLKEGSTTGDAELIDGRIGYDGKVYENIGGAIREQVSELKGDLVNETNRATIRENEIEKLFTMPTQEAVNTWLDEHPEATTTVQDHSLNIDKMVVGTLGYVTPEMFGAVGDGITDDYNSLTQCLNFGKTVVFPNDKTYYIGTPLVVDGISGVNFYFNNTTIKGFGMGSSNVTNIAIVTFMNCSHFDVHDLNTDTQATWIKRTEPYDPNSDYALNRARAYDGLCIKRSNNFKVIGCHVENCCAGFMIGVNKNFIIENCSTYKTLADGFFISSDERGLIKNCYVEKSEDDCFSCHSYTKRTKDVEFLNCKAYDCMGSIVATLGGHNIKYDNCVGTLLRQTPFKVGAYTEGTNSTVYYDAYNVTVVDCIGLCDDTLSAEETNSAIIFPSTKNYPAKNIKFIRSIARCKSKLTNNIQGAEHLYIKDSVIDYGTLYALSFIFCNDVVIENSELTFSQLNIHNCDRFYSKKMKLKLRVAYPIDVKDSTDTTLIDVSIENEVETPHVLYLSGNPTNIYTNIDRIAGSYGETLIHTIGINKNLENLSHINFAPYSMYMKNDGKLYIKNNNGGYVELATVDVSV